MRRQRAIRVVIGFLVGLCVGWWIFRGGLGWQKPHPVEVVETTPTRVSPISQVSPLETNAPKVAIVLDDWGYNLNNLPILNEIDVPMTVAILPHLRFSSQIANTLAKRNYEIILHMPMEAHNGKIRSEEKTLYTYMAEEEIRQTLKGAIGTLPNLKGISNHMGSKATEDQRLLKIVMEELRNDKLYFLDSLVTPQSVAEGVSHQVGVAFAKRSVFLDNHLDPEYIQGQVLKMAAQARKTGSAVGIGHDRPVTLRVLQEMIPKLKKDGIVFVHVSQLAQKN